MDLLIHDLRAPLSVAQGYLRMIKEQRLASAEERDQALAKTMDALGRISGLCTDASLFLRAPGPMNASAPLVPVAHTLEVVCRQLTERDMSVQGLESLDRASWRMTCSSDDLADALVTVIGAAWREGGGRADEASLEITVRANEVRLCFGSAAARDQLGLEPRPPFDAWRGGHGLSLPLACRTIVEAGGHLWQLAVGRGAVGVAFPLEIPDR